MVDGRNPPLGWFDVIRLGLVQMMLGSLVVLAVATINRVMVVELRLPAIVPGLLIGLHYLLQLTRPALGFAGDRGGHRRFILGGVGAMAAGVILAAFGAATVTRSLPAGLALALVGYAALGLGVAATGTSVLALLAARTAPSRRSGAATIVWLMMILGFALTAGIAGHLLQPFSFARLVRIVACFAGVATAVSALAMHGDALHGRSYLAAAAPPGTTAGSPAVLGAILREIWADPPSRRFTIFIFISMLAYGGQELILEPFAGLVFGLAPAATAKLTGLHHGSVLAGLILGGMTGTVLRGAPATTRHWTLFGCLASGVCLAGLALACAVGPRWPLQANVIALGIANGAFSGAAITTMLQLAADRGRAGTSLGLWGAAQAIALALGGVISSGGSDIARHAFGSPAVGYAAVFGLEAGLFLVAGALVIGRFAPASRSAPRSASHIFQLGSPS